MQRSNKNLVVVLGALVISTVLIALWYIMNQGADVDELIGKPIPEAVRSFMGDDEFQGEFFIVLLDVEQQSSVKQFPNVFNSVVRKNKRGLAGRILYAYPTNSMLDKEKYEEFMEGGTTSIIASKSVLYSDKTIERVPKPCVLKTDNGTVKKVLLKQDFDTWIVEKSIER